MEIIYLIKDLYPEYIKNTYNLITKRQTTQLKNGQKEDTKENILYTWQKSIKKDAEHTIQIKMTMRFHYTPIKMA